MPAPTFVLLTDFGLADPYVGQMKGVLARHCPGCVILDLSHGVRPFCIAQGAFFLAVSRRHFPKGSVFLCVVDPGVGGKRSILALVAEDFIFLAPDNGLLSLVLDSCGSARAYDVSAAPFTGPVSSTFHGRDVFAPLAAAIAQGALPSDLGPELPLDKRFRPLWSTPQCSGRSLRAHVLHVDHFGNCILNCRVETWLPLLSSWPKVRLQEPAQASLALAASYTWLSPGEIGLVPGGQGYLEIALNMASAAKALNLDIGSGLLLLGGSEDRP